jgi:hypothetical protein
MESQRSEIEEKEMAEDLEQEPEEAEEVDINYLNEKLENILSKLESLNVEKEIGEKEKNRDMRLIIERIELENFKSYAGVRKIGPLHHVIILIIFRVSMQWSVQMEAANQI